MLYRREPLIAGYVNFGLKRLPVYGQSRGNALIFLADTWSNLLTLARLVPEATFAAWGT